jgi:SAM-dependent methyltransferase
MLKHVIANPWVYDGIQLLAGARSVQRYLAVQVGSNSLDHVVLDLGGGTGLYRGLWPSECLYVCIDIDIHKVRGFRNRYRSGSALVSDVSWAPVKSDSADVVLLVFVAHHVPDKTLAQIIKESMRVLKKSGKFILMDPVWNPRRLLSRVLWRIDRGRYPRRAETLYEAVSRNFRIYHWQHFSVYHEYILCAGTKRENQCSVEAKLS